MSSTSQNATVLLTRLLSLKENSSFHLILDSLTQSSYYLIQEYIHRCSKTTSKIIYLSFETINKPHYCSEFIDCSDITLHQIVEKVNPLRESNERLLILIDSLNYINNDELAHFVAQLVGPEITLVGVYHTQCPVAASKYPNYPSSETLLSYIASTIFELYPLIPDSLDEEELDAKVKKLTFPINSNLNSAIFKVILTNRRKSGRSLTYTLIINSLNHEYEIWKDRQESDEILQEDESLLKDLTTFNLTTSSKQKLAREQVELPFMQAQESLGVAGGAIVYEFEKDDDYDEEDPYEDPF